MAQHVEINPDDSAIPFSLGLKALRSASTQKTHKTGTVRIPTSTGKDFIAGEGAEDGANSMRLSMRSARRPTLPPPVRIRRMRKRRGPASWR